jgi:hypothetical protein
MRESKGFVVFFEHATVALTPEECARDTHIPRMEFRGDTVGGFTVKAGSIMPGHNIVSLEATPRAERFETREEAEAFVATKPNPHRFRILEVVGRTI